MKSYCHDDCTTPIGPPKKARQSVREAIGTLWVRWFGVEVGGEVAACGQSFWRPSPEELAQINAGYAIRLSLLTTEHPAVVMDVVPQGRGAPY